MTNEKRLPQNEELREIDRILGRNRLIWSRNRAM